MKLTGSEKTPTTFILPFSSVYIYMSFLEKLNKILQLHGQ